MLGLGLGMGFFKRPIGSTPAPSPVTVTALSMDGVDDFIQTPSFSYNEVVMRFSADPTNNFQKYFAVNFWYIQTASRPVDNWDTNGFSSIQVNGTNVTNNTDFIPINTVVTMRAVRVNSTAYISHIFRHSAAGGYMKGVIYDVKFYNGGTLVAHYDMSKGNVQDQSGNGYHATLTGGTWVQT